MLNECSFLDCQKSQQHPTFISRAPILKSKEPVEHHFSIIAESNTSLINTKFISENTSCNVATYRRFFPTRVQTPLHFSVPLQQVEPLLLHSRLQVLHPDQSQSSFSSSSFSKKGQRSEIQNASRNCSIPRTI